MIACRRSVDFGVCCVDAARVTLCGVVRCRYSRIDVASSSAARSRAFVILVIWEILDLVGGLRGIDG